MILNHTQNCHVGKVRFYIDGKEFWAHDQTMALLMRHALDVKGVVVIKPKRRLPEYVDGLIILR